MDEVLDRPATGDPEADVVGRAAMATFTGGIDVCDRPNRTVFEPWFSA